MAPIGIEYNIFTLWSLLFSVRMIIQTYVYFHIKIYYEKIIIFLLLGFLLFILDKRKYE